VQEDFRGFIPFVVADDLTIAGLLAFPSTITILPQMMG